MTKKLEELFDLKTEEIPKEEIANLSIALKDANEQFEKLSNTDKINLALGSVIGLNNHDGEMDDIADKAIHSYNDLVKLGMSCTEQNIGKVFEVAGQMLKTALEARDAKVTRKLKTIELMLKKERVDKIPNAAEQEFDGANQAHLIDRNDILDLIKQKAITVDSITQTDESKQNASDKDK